MVSEGTHMCEFTSRSIPAAERRGVDVQLNICPGGGMVDAQVSKTCEGKPHESSSLSLGTKEDCVIIFLYET